MIIQPKNLFVQMSASLDRLTKSYPDPAKPWINLFKNEFEPTKNSKLKDRFQSKSGRKSC